MVGVGIQLAMKFEGADFRRILVPRAVGYESLIFNRQRVVESFGRRFTNSKGVFANHVLHLKAYILHDNQIGHLAPG